MVKIEFIDGTEEVIEFTPQSFEPPYDYDSTCEAFKVRIDGVSERVCEINSVHRSISVLPCQAMSSEENGCKEKAQWGIRRIKLGISEVFNGVSPNGKAQDFDSYISGFESRYPSLFIIFLIDLLYTITS